MNLGFMKNQRRMRMTKRMTTRTSCCVMRPSARLRSVITFLILASLSAALVSGPRLSLWMTRMTSQASTVLSSISGTANPIQEA